MQICFAYCDTQAIIFEPNIIYLIFSLFNFKFEQLKH